MTRHQWLKSSCAVLGTVALLSNTTAAFAAATAPTTTNLTTAQKIALLQQKVKYVFVIFHENESFDHHFGTFPGANGLYTAPQGLTPATQAPGFTQRLLDTSLNTVTQAPFLLPQAVQVGGFGSNGAIVPIYPADQVSTDHSHQGMANGLDVVNGVNQNDRYAMDQEGLTTNGSGQIVKPNGAAPTSITLAQKQKAEMINAHLDCDTIPFMWSWAKNFALFDNFHQTIVGPSTPNAIALIAGQAGETQWALHNNEAPNVTYQNAAFPNPLGASFSSKVAGNSNAFVPIMADPGPFPGSNKDTNATKPPYNFDENASNPTLNQTYASQPLSFMGANIGQTIKYDQNPRADLIDVQHDIFTIATKNQAVNWGWYQQGFNANDKPDPYTPQGTGTPNPTNDPTLYTGYVLHHNGPAYFGYLADNTQVLANNLHGAQDLVTAVTNQTLPSNGGVFYYRGGYSNNLGLVPANPTTSIQHAFIGGDDHPGYSDRQISEASAAQMINAIANSPYWNQSAIVITYDETDGQWDHGPISPRSSYVDGSVYAGGPRIPTIVISPWSQQGVISHQYSEHGSVIKFINELFNLVPLAQLPDEAHARQLGQQNLGQANLGPSDDPNNNLGDLTEVFDYARMQANNPIPPSAATFTQQQIMTLPHLATANYSPNGYTNGACAAIGVLPTDFSSVAAYQAGQPSDPYPIDVNPRPSSSPGTPTSGNWTP